MSKEKQMYPKMVYHPHTGEHVIAANADEIPDGYVRCLSEVTPEGEEKPAIKKASTKKPAKKPAIKKASTKKPAKKAEKTKTALEELSLSREEAIEILDEEKIEHADDASDDEIAALAKDCFED